MKHRLSLFTVVLSLLASVSLAQAGPNADGVLLVHADPLTTYTGDDSPYSGASDLPDCDAARTNVPGGGTTYVWWISAAFPDGSSPRLAGVTFGVDYDDSTIFLVDFGPSGDFELTTGGWPAPNEGTAITFAAARTTQLTEVYWFAGYEYYGYDRSFDLIPHPTQGANFADDAVPSIIDAIADLGRLGFNGDPGYLPCPAGEPSGACCLPDCTCEVLTEAECSQFGQYQGDDTPCDPFPCPCGSEGACCFPDGSCLQLSDSECDVAGGEFFGEGWTCDPNPCPQPEGACCFDDASCLVLREDECANGGGTYQGDGTLCDPNFCDGVSGACCFGDCSCLLMTETNCSQSGGYFLGEGTECDPSPCECPEGACCYPDGSCVILTDMDCEGSYQGDSSTCEPNPCPQPGACCDEQGECLVLFEEECEAEGGQFIGEHVPCDPDPCPTPTIESSWGEIKARYRSVR